MINHIVAQLSVQLLGSRMVHARFEVQLRDALLLGISLQIGEDVFRDAHSPVAFFHVHAFDFGVIAHDFYGANADQLRASVGTEHVRSTFEQHFDGIEVAVFPTVQFDLEGIQFGNEGLHLFIRRRDGGDGNGNGCHWYKIEAEVSVIYSRYAFCLPQSITEYPQSFTEFF